MRIKLVFNSGEPFINLPLHHNVTIQGMLYKSLPKFLSDFLHEIGFFYNGRRFKLFTFSKIFSERFILDTEKKRIKYKTPITLYISSAVDEITKNWGEYMLKKDQIKLGKNELFLETIEVQESPELNEEFNVRTLSPITVYRTFENGKKFYRYYKPQEEEFEELIRDNLRKKYNILTGKNLGTFPISIEPTKKIRKVLIKYKDFPIEAYEGIFKIKTDPELFKVVYDTGLGSKNSQGFGMVEVV
ncbi:MAG: CRISPR-associated endoribonuclease Cas6 [Aquificae bacterium]|nr:CRISPR-associated endoribonuclease Cas6 [Aquificota bacterium]